MVKHGHRVDLQHCIAVVMEGGHPLGGDDGLPVEQPGNLDEKNQKII